MPVAPVAGVGGNKFGFEDMDHVTANFQTMKPMLLWMEHVLGFEQFWEVAFHTSDAAKAVHGANTVRTSGSGLKSIVMWDPASRVRFANNEPARPFFRNSQINVFNEELRGDGVQHVALSVRDILTAVRELRANGVAFMPTPASYYDLLPERIEKSGIKTIDEDIGRSCASSRCDRRRSTSTRTCWQIFLKESAGLYGDPDPQGRPVLLRDHPAQGRRTSSARWELSRAVREHRARAPRGIV